MALSTSDVSRKRRRRRAGGALALTATTVIIGTGLSVVPASQLLLLKAASDNIITPHNAAADVPGTSPRKLSNRVRSSRKKIRVGSFLPKRQRAREQDTSSAAIPRILYFTHKENILETRQPFYVYDNVMHTISEYRRLWRDPEAPVKFLDDDMCRDKIQKTEPRLLRWFDAETLGMYKADICRVSALYLTGGYYADIDIRVHEPVALSPNTTFASSREAVVYLNCKDPCPRTSLEKYKFKIGAHPYGKNNLFQAFLATSPGHPVLKLAFRKMLDYYERRLDLHGGLGVSTLGDALAETMPSLKSGSVRLLEEIKNEPHMTVYYPDLPEQEGIGTGCRKVVHDPAQKKVYFYSRIPGVDKSCVSTKFNSTIPDKVVVLPG